jgi:hypothetical protein
MNPVYVRPGHIGMVLGVVFQFLTHQFGKLLRIQAASILAVNRNQRRELSVLGLEYLVGSVPQWVDLLELDPKFGCEIFVRASGSINFHIIFDKLLGGDRRV